MKFKLRLSKRAVQDVEEVLVYTLAQFGERKYEQYKELIRQALADIAADPYRPPARHRPEIGVDIRTFHIARPGKKARHLFLYRVVQDELVDLGRLLHDSMDLRRHQPEAWEATD